ncbi:hypothetical protein Tco_1087328, partial [Tanacetum coccineum]
MLDMRLSVHSYKASHTRNVLATIVVVSSQSQNTDLQLIFLTLKYCIPSLTGLLHAGKCYISSHVAAGIVADSKRLTWSCDTVRNEK